mmetsp:Transcript_102485/g.182065  ORF Transcript_102485/g.182065 Transcript_102485/m.182065 type:complete len:252 (-) Transcript_102485:2335-3090(-)
MAWTRVRLDARAPPCHGDGASQGLERLRRSGRLARRRVSVHGQHPWCHSVSSLAMDRGQGGSSGDILPRFGVLLLHLHYLLELISSGNEWQNPWWRLLLPHLSFIGTCPWFRCRPMLLHGKLYWRCDVLHGNSRSLGSCTARSPNPRSRESEQRSRDFTPHSCPCAGLGWRWHQACCSAGHRLPLHCAWSYTLHVCWMLRRTLEWRWNVHFVCCHRGGNRTADAQLDRSFSRSLQGEPGASLRHAAKSISV